MSLTTADQWSTTLVDQTSGSDDHLAPLAEALRLPFEKATRAELRVNRVPVILSLQFDSGVVTALRMTALFEAPPDAEPGPFIRLRKETSADRRDKEQFVSVEVQVGARKFDDDVYIDSNAGDAEVHRVLARPETRGALHRLLHCGLIDLVELRTTLVTVDLKRRGQRWDREQLVEALEDLLIIVRGGGPRGAPRPRRGEGLESSTAIAFAFGLAAMLGAIAAWGAGTLFGVVGFLFMGAATTALARPFVRPAVAGDSGSGARLRTVLALLFLAGGGFGLAALLAFNALATSEGPTTTLGSVVDIGSYDSEDSTWSVRFRWEDGSSSRQSLRYAPALGTPAERVRQAGYLVPWGEQVRVR